MPEARSGLEARRNFLQDPAVILPFNRARLRERNALDDAEDQAAAAQRSRGERVELSLDLSQLVRAIASVGRDGEVGPPVAVGRRRSASPS